MIALATTVSAPAFAGMNGTDWINRVRPPALAPSGLDARAEFVNPGSTLTVPAVRHDAPHAYRGGPRSIH
ncbi:hypothetical protein IP86_17235 [Rhodopseudomonas sp. AAP120]|nr:hypothetical protein IP86_17235 [Rhodopseudomonas sp. AAP120]